jgi:hypothetical protein
LADSSKPGGESSSTIWIGSTVITFLGLLFGTNLMILGSLFRWRSDSVLGLYNVSGWRYDHLIGGDGRITLALGALVAAFLLVGLLAQNRAAFMGAVIASAASLSLALYEVIYIATRPGITGPGTGLYMVIGGGVAGLMCSLGGYLMMVERHRQSSASDTDPAAPGVV